jgi:hypothetical protein
MSWNLLDLFYFGSCPGQVVKFGKKRDEKKIEKELSRPKDHKRFMNPLNWVIRIDREIIVRKKGFKKKF